MILFTDKKTAAALQVNGLTVVDTATLPEQWDGIKAKLDAGESFFFLGTENIDILKNIWIFSAASGNAPAKAVLTEEGTGLTAADIRLQGARDLFVRPTGTYAMHGVDDEPRMDIVPLLQSYGAYGNLRGCPALLLRHHDASLTGGNFKNAFWYIFALEDPCACLPAAEWDRLIAQAAAYAAREIFIASVQPEYTLYHGGECAKLTFRVASRAREPIAFSVQLDAYTEDGAFLQSVGFKECIVTAGDTCTDSVAWYLPQLPNGAVTVSMQLRLHDRMIYGAARENQYTVVDTMSTAFLMHTQPMSGPVAEVKDGHFCIDGKADFFIGTHLYPSADFFELSYRPVKLLQLLEGVRAIKQAGVKFCRIWADPVLDEVSIRGMESVVRVFALNGIAVNFMFFSSWVHYMEVHTAAHDIRFEVATLQNERLIGLYMHNMPQQKIFVSTLVERWKDLKNIVWDFSNEFAVIDPLPEQLDVDWLCDDYKAMEKPYDNIRLFELWALEIKKAVRACGSAQPVVFGVNCWDTGNDNYRCSKQADLMANHGYYLLSALPYYLFNSSSACIGKPQYMEEFGGTWPDNVERARDYDMRYHYFMGAGEDVAMNYEWGVLWLCDQLPGTPPYLKMQSHIPEDQLQDCLYSGRYVYGKSWPVGSTGVCPWMASFEYGNAYGCMNYPSPTTMVMRRTADLGEGLARTLPQKAVYLVMPYETRPFQMHVGYTRYMDTLGNTVITLLQNGVDFVAWQEDELASLPASAKVVIYPNQLPIRPAQQQLLDALKQRGVAVYTGEDTSYLQDAALCKLSFTAPEGTHVMLRDTEAGEMTLLIHPNETAGVFTAEKGGQSVGFDFCRSGSFVWNKGLRRAEFTGALQLNGRQLARFEPSGCTAFGKVLLAAEGEQTLTGDALTVCAYDAGTLTVNGVYTRAQVLDTDGNEVDAFTPDTVDGNTVLSLTMDHCIYRVRLSR